MAGRKTTKKQTDWGRRLTLLRAALGERSKSAFAAKLGMSSSRWSNVETGNQEIGRGFAELLVAKVPGLSVNWLWFGDKNGLSYDLARKIDGHAADFAATAASVAQHSHRGGPIKAGTGSLEFSGNFDGYFSDNLMNRTYYVSYEGKAHSYEIDHETANKLLLAKIRVYSSFRGGAPPTETPA